MLEEEVEKAREFMENELDLQLLEVRFVCERICEDVKEECVYDQEEDDEVSENEYDESDVVSVQEGEGVEDDENVQKKEK